MALKSPRRQWTVLLLLDTSRLARRTYIAHVFGHECRKRGVEIVYARLPETDPITRVVLENVFQAFDEVHSLMSREKGLAGMRENVKRGWRAGGRAPWGYALEHNATGAVRDGQPVSKTRLRPSPDATRISRYLKGRAAGRARATLCRELNIAKSPSSLVGVEWNALTYAGHTVWNVHAEHIEGAYVGGHKRRPRDQWVVQEDTHEALITVEEAEAILSRLENSSIGQAVSAAKSGASSYLLSGLLFAPDGRKWLGHARARYRVWGDGECANRTVARAELDKAVIGQLTRDMQSKAFAKQLLRASQQQVSATSKDTGKRIKRELSQIDAQIKKALELAMRLEDADPALRQVEELEQRRKAIKDDLATAEQEQRGAAKLASVTPGQVLEILEERLGALADCDPAAAKPAIQALVSRIVLDPQTLECEVHYRISDPMCVSLASPTGFEPVSPP